MLRKIFSCFALPLLLLLSNSTGNSASQLPEKSAEAQTGTLEKMIVGQGSVAMDLDSNRLNGTASGTKDSKSETLRFQVGPNSFFTILVFNDALRGPEAGTMGLIPENTATLPGPLQTALNQLVIEKLASDAPYDLAVRDGKTGLGFFNIEGNLYEYDAAAHLLSIKGGTLRISEELANMLGRPADAGVVVGEISITTTMYPIEITTVVNGAAQSAVLPARGGTPEVPNFVPGPDVIVGDLPSLSQFGSTGTRVGLAVGTTSCNNGNVELNWFQMPNTDHPVIPQNLYRMSGGATNDERFEQIGQSWLKHAFTALQQNACSFGCTSSGTGTRLGVGCSDPYGASLNASQSGLGSRAWVNPFTGFYPTTANNHSGHGDSSAAATHRILVEGSDLNTNLNPGATYYVEAQYVTPHEYAWCQTHPGQCNMYNNASYRRFNVSGTTSFSFAAAGSTVRTAPAINAWPGATINTIEPEPGVDGRAFIAWKVTGPVAGVWHYEYAINNQNLDRGIQSFSVPLGCGITLTNAGFHAPPNHPGIANDGTQGSAGFSNAAWTPNQTTGAMTWSTETFAQNQNANAIRWGTLYNFRFDSDRPPMFTNATIGYFKNGAPSNVVIQAPNACNATPTPIPTVTPTPGITPTPTPTPTVTPTPPSSPTPPPPTVTPTPPSSPTPSPSATTTPLATPSATPSIPPPPPTPPPTATPATPTPTPATPTPTPALTPTPTPPTSTPTPIPGAQPNNLSTRMRAQTGDNVGIGGFIINGTAPKHVLLRAIGPSLAQSGVPNAMADTVLELHGPSGFATINNDNWRDDPAQEAAIQATGIAPTNNLESAIATTLNPGAYTAVVRGKNNTSGVALVEIYDLSQAVLAKLANISTRAFVGTGDNIVIAGFTLGGQNHDGSIVVRGLGPSLAAAGMSNALTDPTLELRDGNGALLMANNDWQDNPAQRAELMGAGLEPGNPLESAIAAMLPPGAYTALLAGMNNGAGIGLVEVYDRGP